MARFTMSSPLQPVVFEPSAAPINRHAELAEQEGVAWVLRFFPELRHHAGRLRKLRAAKFARLAARGLPRAPLAELQLVCDWITWLFFYDDGLCDDSGAQATDPMTRLRDVQERMLAVLTGAEPRARDGQLVHMLADLRERTRAWADAAFLPRFHADIARYFQSNVWELDNLQRGASPCEPLYLKMRPLTGAAPVVFDLIELVGHQPVQALREHALVQQLELLANNAICWANDIGSLDKELLEGNPHNLVLVLRNDHRLTMDEALARASAMHAAELAAFEELFEKLPGIMGLSDLHVRGYLADIRSFVGGNLVWMQETMRYRACLSMRSYGEAA